MHVKVHVCYMYMHVKVNVHVEHLCLQGRWMKTL